MISSSLVRQILFRNYDSKFQSSFSRSFFNTHIFILSSWIKTKLHCGPSDMITWLIRGSATLGCSGKNADPREWSRDPKFSILLRIFQCCQVWWFITNSVISGDQLVTKFLCKSLVIFWWFLKLGKIWGISSLLW